jgi:hypothetical protein
MFTEPLPSNEVPSPDRCIATVPHVTILSPHFHQIFLLQFLHEHLNSSLRDGLGRAKEFVPFVKRHFYMNKVNAAKIPPTESFVSKNTY